MQYFTPDVLEFYGISCRNAENNSLAVLCPFHDDKNPSGKIDLETGRYICWACKKSCTVLDYVSKTLNRPIRTVYFEVGKLDSTPSKFAIEDPDNVEMWHLNLFKNEELLKQLYARGITDALIREQRLGAYSTGEGQTVIHIPIRSKRGEVIGFKAYSPGATEKKFSWPNFGVNRRNKKEDIRHAFFPVEQLIYPTILICGGELKALAATPILNPHDIGAISGTGSENTEFSPTQLELLRDKCVYVCYDIDDTGRTWAEIICKALRNYCADIYKVILPLDKEKYPHGDLNDYIVIGGNLIQLLRDTPKWIYVQPTFEDGIKDEAPIDVSLSDAVSAGMAKKKVRVRTVISSMDIQPYSIPKDVVVCCDRGFKMCSICKIYQMFETSPAKVILSKERIEIMEMVDEKLRSQEVVLKKAFGIPIRCARVGFNIESYYHVEDVRISEQLDIASRTNERSMQMAYCVGEKKLSLELNESYVMTGRMYPHPDNQRSALLITEVEAVQDALSTYVPQNLDRLQVFRPEQWTLEALTAKLNAIYDDLSTNVTRIYGRQDMHLLYDLAYHSVLLLPNNLKGWVEVLVVGDSAQGKTLCVDRLISHYGLGERIVCKGATVPGLLGGVQQHGTRWIATWGKIPTNDRRLVVLDEVKGTRTEVIAGLTDMRSSGIAELTKIEKRRTNARARLIMISNPRSELVVREYNSGVDIIRELIGSPEDIRRFDAVMVVAQKEVDDQLIHARDRPEVPHVYTNELCRELVLFAWTVPNVWFEDDYYIGEVSMQLTKQFVEDIPIIDSGTIREKLMRLSTALAARTFSLVDPKTIAVRKCHIDYIVQYLKRIYGESALGYTEYSRKKIMQELIVRPEMVQRRILKAAFPQELVNALLQSEEIDANLIQDVLGWENRDARDLLAFFNRHNALKRVNKTYRRTVGFTALLKKIEASGEGRPSHIEEAEEF